MPRGDASSDARLYEAQFWPVCRLCGEALNGDGECGGCGHWSLPQKREEYDD